MSAKFQVVIDCRDPVRMSSFWAVALGYEIEPPPEGFGSWHDYWRDVGVPAEELGGGPDRISDPTGNGPRIWFQVVDEPKVVKNRLHFDLHASGGRQVHFNERKKRVEAEADRLVGAGARRLRTLFEEGLDHYAVAMEDPEGNEFDIN
jgi:Glyoxalase-like domain